MTADEFVKCWIAACKSHKAVFDDGYHYGDNIDRKEGESKWRFTQWYTVEVGSVKLGFSQHPESRIQRTFKDFTAKSDATDETLTVQQVNECVEAHKYGRMWDKRMEDTLKRIELA